MFDLLKPKKEIYKFIIHFNKNIEKSEIERIIKKDLLPLLDKFPEEDKNLLRYKVKTNNEDIIFYFSNEATKLKFINHPVVISITKQSKQTKRKEAQQKLFESLKDVLLDMEEINKIKQQMSSTTQHNHYKDIESPEEYRLSHWALHYSMIGDYETAIKYSAEGLKLNPKNAFFLYLRGRTKGDIGQFTEGIKDLNEALKLNPAFSDVFVERGVIKQAMGDIEGAVEDYEKAKEIEPTITLPEFKPNPALEEKDMLPKEVTESLNNEGNVNINIYPLNKEKPIHLNEGYLRGRGINFYIHCSPIPNEKELKQISDLILNHYLFQNDFKDTEIYLRDKFSNNASIIRIHSPIFSNRALKLSEINLYYIHIFDELFEYIKEILNKNNFKLIGYKFEINYQIHPKEPDGIIPMPTNLNFSNRKLDEA